MRNKGRRTLIVISVLVFVIVSVLLIRFISPRIATMDLSCYSRVGVNLSGAEWAGYDDRPNASELDYYAQKGVRCIRLPLSWSKLQPNLYGSLSSDEVAWVKDFVLKANDRGMQVILDLHLRSQQNDLNFSSKLPGNALVDFWKKFAGEMGRVPGMCGYVLADEPNNTPGKFSQDWVSIAKNAITAIRLIDKQRYIFVTQTNWSNSISWNTQQANSLIHADPANRLVFEAHSFWDSNASGVYDSESAPANVKQVVYDNLAPFLNWCASTKQRCFVGGFGVPPTTDWLEALEYALLLMKQNRIGGAYWAGGIGWGKNYALSIEPTVSGNGIQDRPQMGVLQNYLKG